MTQKTAISEDDTQNRIRVAISELNGFLWRNNSGAHQTTTKQWVRYGLANDSAKQNKTFKSSDLIGLIPREIQQQDVGKTIAQFVAIEVKRPGWYWVPSDEHGQAQSNFIRAVNERGGIASFISHPDQFEGIINGLR